MINKKCNRFFFSFPCLVLAMCGMGLGGCHTLKKATQTPSHISESDTASHAERNHASEITLLQSKVQSNTISFQTFSARAKLDMANDQGKQEGITAFIRMQKDSAIWISVRPLLGIELIRMMITPDSVKMINYIKKTIYIRSADSIRQIVGIPLSFQALQSVIVGNPAYLSDSLTDIEHTASLITFSCLSTDIISHFALFADDFQLQENKLTERDSSQTVTRSFDQIYGDYEQMAPYRFATRRRIFFHADRMSQIDIKFNRVDFDKPLSFPFAVGDKFSVK